MLRHCLSLLLVTSLVASGAAAWADANFVDISATNGYTKAWPTGVSAGGAVVMQGLNTSGYPYTYYDVDYYPGGTSGTMTKIDSLFTGGSTFYASAMNDSGQATVFKVALGGHQGWLYSGGTSATSFNVLYDGVNAAFSTLSAGINSAGDVGGTYMATTGGTNEAFVYIGGVSYTLNPPADNPATYGATVTALNARGQAVGSESSGVGIGLPTHCAEVWSYAISGGSMVSQTATDLQLHGLAAAYPGVRSSQALAINNLGTVVVGASNSSLVSCPNVDTAYFLYDMNTHAFTSLGSLMLYDPIVGTTSMGGGHDQAINDAEQVVGRIDVSSDGSGNWHAAIWDPTNGVRDLNTTLAGLLPAGFTLTMASAIDNNGDIAGWGSDGTNDNQAFVVMNARLSGDANLDGTVDIQDLSKVLANYDKSGMLWADGDFDANGTVDIQDLSKILANYDKTVGASAGIATVPEPGTLVLMALPLAAVAACAGRRRK